MNEVKHKQASFCEVHNTYIFSVRMEEVHKQVVFITIALFTTKACLL